MSEINPTTILIVDDSIETRLLLRLMLSAPHRRFLEAGTGQQGITFAEAERPDVILLDVMLPDRDGFEVCSYLRQSARCRTSKIAMITALDSREMHATALAAGAHEFWAKPIDVHVLRDGVRRLLTEDTPAHAPLQLLPA